MKLTPSSLCLWIASSIAATLPGWTGPLQRGYVAADAKWVLHLDLDAFRTTQIGGAILLGKAQRDIDKARADLKTYLDFDLDWTQIHSLTAYGTAFEPHPPREGVLLVQTDLDVQKALETAIAKQTEADVETHNVKRVEDNGVPMYNIRDEVFAALPPGKPIVLAKTAESARKGLAVLNAQTPTLAGSSAFNDFPPVPPSFVFLGMAQGFADQAPLPPQAKVLQMTESGSLVLGETGNQVFVTVSLKPKSADVARQMQQVLQGLLALAALGQVENQDLQQLVQGTRVDATDRLVTVQIQIPIQAVLQKIEEKRKP